MRYVRQSLLGLLSLWLGACGGGGGDSAPDVDANRSPQGISFSYVGTPPVSDEYMAALFDYYADYWTNTRVAYNAGRHHLAGIHHQVVFDCTFPCRSSPNGLCAGENDGWIQVAYYRLRRAVNKPAGWETRLKPRTAVDMYLLSNNEYWLNQENQFFWCENANPPMPALLHEWDHLIFDPHDPQQNLLIVPLPHTFTGP